MAPPVQARPTHAVNAILVGLYALLLAAVYEYIISPRFSYLAFTSVHPDPVYILFGACVCAVLAFLLPSQISRPSDLGRIVIFFIITVPSVIIPLFLDEDWPGISFQAQIYGVVAFVAVTAILAVLPRDAVTSLRLPGDSSLYVLLAIAAVGVAVLGASYGFAIEFHSLSTVYDQREIYSEGGGGTGFVGIATGLLQNALAPIFLAVGMHRKSLRWFGVGVLLLLYVYSITGVKSALIGMLFVVAIFALARNAGSGKFLRRWSIGLVSFVLVAGIGSGLSFMSIAIDLIVRRILIMQGLLTYNYVAFFEGLEPTYFSHTIFGVFFQRPFEGIPAEIVGDLLFGRSVHANASFVSDGYVAWKLLGVIITGVVIAVFLGLLDSLTAGLPLTVSLAAACMSIYILTQSGVITALVNHGGLALALSLWLAGPALARGRDAKGSVLPKVANAGPSASGQNSRAI